MDNKRLLSIDALRGFDMMFIMGFAAIITTTCELFPGGGDCWLHAQMSHAKWDGLFHHDTIFPLFLFISGMTFPFSLASRRERGDSSRKVFFHCLWRGLILFLFGLVCNGLFKFAPNLRIPSVLGRIGMAWMFAAWIFLAFGWKARSAIAAALLLLYGLLTMIPAPDAAGASCYSMQGNIACYIDRTLMPNHIYKIGLYDPEGLLSTLPAIVTAMLGQFTGQFIKDSRKSRKTLWLLGAAVALLASGLLWSLWQPINKALWSCSFTLVVGAYSVAVFALFYWLIDVKGWKRWTPFFSIIGMNSITIYMVQRIVPFKEVTNFFFGGAAALMSPPRSAWLLAIGYFAISWLFLWFLYRRKIFLKV